MYKLLAENYKDEHAELVNIIGKSSHCEEDIFTWLNPHKAQNRKHIYAGSALC